MNGFHVKAKNERFTAASSRCCQNLKCENFTSSFGRLRQNIAPNIVPHVQHDYFSSFNQANHWFVAVLLTLPSPNLKLPNVLENCHDSVVYYPALTEYFFRFSSFSVFRFSPFCSLSVMVGRTYANYKIRTMNQFYNWRKIALKGVNMG